MTTLGPLYHNTSEREKKGEAKREGGRGGERGERGERGEGREKGERWREGRGEERCE